MRKLAVALAIAGLFALLSIFPRIGYLGEADVKVIARDPFGFWLVLARCNMSYNPFLYGFSWLAGSGQFSGTFRYVSVPTYAGGGFPAPVWRNTPELQDEALIRLVLTQLYMNIPYNFIILLVVELTRMRDVYLCLIGGVIGFPFGGPLTALAGFFAGVFLIVFIMPRVRRGDNALMRIWNSFWKPDEIPE